MRLIDADALIDKAETVLDEHETIWFDAVSVNNIHSAPTIDAVSVDIEREWIDAEEEMPIDGEEVLVTVYWEGYGDTILAYGHYSPRFDKWKLYSDAEGELIKGFNVTAWMPLPKPYEREGE